MPCDPANHLDFLHYKYYQTSWYPNCNEIYKVANCPEKAALARENEEKLEKLFNTNICKNIIDEMISDLPERPNFVGDAEWSCQESKSLVSADNTKLKKGFSVTFQSNGDISSASQNYEFLPSDSTNDMVVYLFQLVSLFIWPLFKDSVDDDRVGDSISKALLELDENPFLSVLSTAQVNEDMSEEEQKNSIRSKVTFAN